MRDWTTKERQYLADNYKNMTARDVGQILGRSVRSVRYQVIVLGLQKSENSRNRPKEKQKNRFPRHIKEYLHRGESMC
jgi:hypothetical protein